MKYAYYPGCSSETLSSGYEVSLQAVSHLLGLELVTIPDWNCCGATEYMAVSRLASYAVAARNLALVPEDCHTVVASCSACFLNLKRVEVVMTDYPEVGEKVNEAMAAGGLSYGPGRLQIRHILDVFLRDIGLEHIQEQVTKPLSDLQVAPYYGCMLVRPTSCFGQPEYPVGMDTLLGALGAVPLDFSLRGYCCGGHLPQIKADTGFEIIHRILNNAEKEGANCIAVACPVCQLNLDLYQRDVNLRYGTNFEFPVLFFTQLMGLAFGLKEEELGLDLEAMTGGRLLGEARSQHDTSGYPGDGEALGGNREEIS
ncbi:MAG: CoB--CoM heterodisulfide reductase iron-sulfur subunit B family protein [Proteobacteria bacterium]|nr:CoB--CoM heterodisulfide reductase iron-sulfur subunit B family protein [Pseudomonadota bacterium]MBU1688749.1 CoB--CoM heterodisulfide reductase iron-sulfur subunit B family protein [Pseudomonadota bacterium]